MTKIAILISGSGSNLQAMLDDAVIRPHIGLVLSNKADAYGLTRAKNAGVQTAIVSHKGFDTREQFDRAVHDILQQENITHIVLAGFMRLLSPWFAKTWCGKMVNIHPSLLPAFKGANAIQDAFDYGVKITGISVHHVIADMDAGQIIDQVAVPIAVDDTLESLTQKMHAAEHIIYPKAVKGWLGLDG